MSVAAAALALARPFEFNGQSLQLKPLTYEDLARFSLWLEARARAAVERSIEDGVDAKTAWGAYYCEAAAGRFEPGSDVFDQATRTTAGNRKLLELMLAPPADHKRPDVWQQDTSWLIAAEDADFQRANRLMQEINSDPLAVKGRRMPARLAAPSP